MLAFNAVEMGKIAKFANIFIFLFFTNKNFRLRIYYY